MFMVFHVSFALILGFKDEPYDETIIVLNASSFSFYFFLSAMHKFCL